MKKTVGAIDAGLTPIVCVGECEKENVEAVLAEQFERSISTRSRAVRKNRNSLRTCLGDRHGAGRCAETAAAAHRFIRDQARASFGVEAADNAKYLIAQPGIDGFLVGGASLDPVGFASIANL